MDDKRLDKIEESLSDISDTLVRQQVILDQHVKRCDLLEAQVEPIKTHLTELKGAIKFLKFIGILATIAECIRMYLR